MHGVKLNNTNEDFEVEGHGLGYAGNTNESSEDDVDAHALGSGPNTNESSEDDEVEAHGVPANTNETIAADD